MVCFFEVFVCFEFQVDNNYIISLNNQTNYFKFCQCNGYIHVNCLNLWYEKNETCPICRNSIKLVDSLELYNVYQYQYGLYIMYSFICTKKIFADFLLFSITLIHFLYVLGIAFIILNTINEIYKGTIIQLENKIHNNYLLENYEEPLLDNVVYI